MSQLDCAEKAAGVCVSSVCRLILKHNSNGRYGVFPECFFKIYLLRIMNICNRFSGFGDEIVLQVLISLLLLFHEYSVCSAVQKADEVSYFTFDLM